MSVTPAENGFVEGDHPEAYDLRGNFTGNTEPAATAAPAVAAPAQVAVVPSETAGYLAPGGTTRLSIRDRIAAARPYKSELVEVPDWDATIEVRSIPLGERQELMASIVDEAGNVDTKVIVGSFILACSYDPETGEKVFSQDDLQFIQTRDSAAADKVGKTAMRLSGMGQTEDAAKKS